MRFRSVEGIAGPSAGVEVTRDSVNYREMMTMIRPLLRFFGLVDAEADSAKFEPVFGLPRRSLDEWLSRHPSMRETYDAELARITERRRGGYRDSRN
jgi:hypothetical protein